MTRSPRWMFCVLILAIAKCMHGEELGFGSESEWQTGTATGRSLLQFSPSASASGGDGTHYSLQGLGNCGFPDQEFNGFYAAMNSGQYAGSRACGACLQVKGPKGTVTVRIIDRCPECGWGAVDMSQQAFSRIAAVSAGRVKISWKVVRCPFSTQIQFKIKEGSNPWHLEVQVAKSQWAVNSLMAKRGNLWQQLQRTEYNYFLTASGLGKGPFTFRVQLANGQTVTASGVPLAAGSVVGGRSQAVSYETGEEQVAYDLDDVPAVVAAPVEGSAEPKGDALPIGALDDRAPAYAASAAVPLDA